MYDECFSRNPEVISNENPSIDMAETTEANATRDGGLRERLMHGSIEHACRETAQQVSEEKSIRMARARRFSVVVMKPETYRFTVD